MGRTTPTRMLSGFRSACKRLHFRNKPKPKNSCWAYALTAFILIPTSLPNFFNTSRRLMLKVISVEFVRSDNRSFLPQILEDHTQVTFVFKIPFKPYQMFLVFRVRM